MLFGVMDRRAGVIKWVSSSWIIRHDCYVCIPWLIDGERAMVQGLLNRLNMARWQADLDLCRFKLSMRSDSACRLIRGRVITNISIIGGQEGAVSCKVHGHLDIVTE